MKYARGAHSRFGIDGWKMSNNTDKTSLSATLGSTFRIHLPLGDDGR
jgi:hypothetical protein